MRIPRRIAALAVAATAAITLTPAASALTVSPNFPNTPFETEESFSALSPYANPARCTIYRDSIGECWQQRPDGQWVRLEQLGFLRVYPVWEDPAALAGGVPPQFRRDALRNATPEPLRSAIPQQVWDALPR